jgi:hypothetical protein
VGEGSLATFAEWFYSAPTCAIGPTELRTAIAAWLAENGQPAPAPQS